MRPLRLILQLLFGVWYPLVRPDSAYHITIPGSVQAGTLHCINVINVSLPVFPVCVYTVNISNKAQQSQRYLIYYNILQKKLQILTFERLKKYLAFVLDERFKQLINHQNCCQLLSVDQLIFQEYSLLADPCNHCAVCQKITAVTQIWSSLTARLSPSRCLSLSGCLFICFYCVLFIYPTLCLSNFQSVICRYLPLSAVRS